ncbi:MAG TPA: FeoA family protein [Oligoflexia bacterium]|nr:FeoA family protein [Oligoflexia bacterium]HMP47448.1 FeoA family protein [Oligoflexia bacterium]
MAKAQKKAEEGFVDFSNQSTDKHLNDKLASSGKLEFTNYLALDQLNPGQTALVKKIETPISLLKSRLLALGLVNDTQVKVKNIAPLGDPMSIEIRGFCLSMRKDEAKAIKVLLED